MVENNSDEQGVYQYFTIIGDDDSLNSKTPNGDYSFINTAVRNKGSEDQNGQEVMFMVDPLASDMLPSAVMPATNEKNQEHAVNDGLGHEYDPLVCPKIEFVLKDGRMFMTDINALKEVDESYTFDPELICVAQDGEECEGEASPSVETEDVEEVNITSESSEILSNVKTMDDDIESEVVNEGEEINFWKVQLADGTYAYINNTLWINLIHNMKPPQDETPKVVLPTALDKKIPCSYYGCNKVYSSTHHLSVHMRNHTGSRPYQCPFMHCNKAFTTGYSLKAHLRTHTGEAPYGCVECQKSFKTSGDLQKHVRTHTGEKPFKCPMEGCDRSFTTSNIRKVHIRSHTGERPYLCTHPDCNKAFASATNFKNHMRIHSGEKPYKCPVAGCGKRFTEYSSLYKHNAVHVPFTPIKCEYCDQLCKHESTLLAHKQLMHKIIVTDDGTEVQLRKESGSNYIHFLQQ